MAGHKRGDCFLIPSGGKNHLFTIVLGPATFEGYGPNEQVVLVSVTTVKPEFPHDTACILSAGDHPFITHDSYVLYRKPEVYTVQEVDKMIQTMGWQPRDACSPEMFEKVVEGMRTSKMLPRYIKALFV